MSDTEITEEIETQAQANGIPTSNLSTTDIDQDTEASLRGDAIGDTTYSQSFVAKTLLKLSDVKWNEEMEEDLCFLWDMTVERDVCAYLFELSYPSIASAVVKTYTEERLIEIVVGILANIFCASCVKDISAASIDAVLEVLGSDDPLILIQVARFIKALTHFDSALKFLNVGVMEKFTFILTNSLNTGLLSNCLDVVATLCLNEVFTNNYLSAPLYCACLSAYRTIRSKEDEDLFFESAEMQGVFTHLMGIIVGFAAYIDESRDSDLLQKIRNENGCFLEEARKVLQFYADDVNLLPITDTFKFFIESFGYIFPVLSLGYDSAVFKELIKIVITLIENSLETEEFNELLCYLVSNAGIEKLESDSKKFEDKDIVLVLNKFKGTLEACQNETCKQILSNYMNK